MSGVGMDRRAFVRRLPVLGGAAAGFATIATSGCAGVVYLEPVVTPAGLTIASSALPAEGGVFVQGRGMERPVFVHRAADGRPRAVLASCTHRGCQPEPVGERLVCPCHGSEFAFDGSLLGGPAEAPLTTYRVTESDGSVTLHLDDGVSR